MDNATADDAVVSIRRAVPKAGEEFERLGDPANMQAVKWFGERLLQWRWPSTYLGVLRTHDGVAFTSPILFDFLSSIRVFLVFQDRWFRERPRWRVGGDGCGSYWVLSFDEQREDGECPVRFIDHEDGPLSDGSVEGITYADFVVRLFDRLGTDQ
jgi:hypothetical protein